MAAAKGRLALSADSQSVSDLISAKTALLPSGSVQSGSASPAVGLSDSLSSTAVSQLTDQLCAAAGAIALAVPDSGQLVLTNQSLGSLAAPQIHCIDGLAGPGDAVTISGNSTGAGILVVRNADLILNGILRWDGLIIVTGGEVALRSSTSSATTVYGSLMINETGNPSPSFAALELAGSFRGSFSRMALNPAAGLIPSSQLAGLYASLPVSIKQDYWRSVTP